MRPSRSPTARQSGPQSTPPVPAQPASTTTASNVSLLMSTPFCQCKQRRAVGIPPRKMLESRMRILFVVLLACSTAAAAQSNPPQEDLGTLLGIGVRSRPDYDGASKQEVEPIPVIRYYGRTLFVRTTQGILEGGARWEIFPGFAAGVQLAYEDGNDLSDLDSGVSLGLHAEWDTRIGP